MPIYYSASKKGFFDTSSIDYTLPDDAIEIERSYYQELLADQSTGKFIQPNDEGVPVAVNPPIPAVTKPDVNRERSRRIAEGVVVSVEGYGDVALQGRLEDQINLIGLYNGAMLRISQGDTTTVTKFRDRDNVDHDLTPPQIVDMWAKGSSFVSQVIQASWDVKDLDPIPLDYTDDKYWP